MDGARFDDVLRALTASPTRRRIGQTLTGFALAGPLAVFVAQPAAEAKKHKKKHKKKKKGGKNGARKCGKACIPAADCCTAADCASGELLLRAMRCTDPDAYLCSDSPNCACATSIDNVNGCVNIRTAICTACESDADCTQTLGKPSLCLSGGVFCCGGGDLTCASLCAD